MHVVIQHNPDRGTSRNVLTTNRAAGYEPAVIEYPKTGWTRQRLLGLGHARIHPVRLVRGAG